jgi:hypothetical protein
MMELMKWLQGKKTYIIAISMGVMAMLKQLEVIDQAMFDTLLTLLSGGGLASFYAMMNRKKVEK